MCRIDSQLRTGPLGSAATDLVNRQFTVDAPDPVVGGRYNRPSNRGGKTVLRRGHGPYSRRIVGWSMAEHVRTELVLDAIYE